MMFGRNPGSDRTVDHIPLGSTGAELGVWKGDTSAKFLTRAGHLHLVDSWSPIPYEESGEWGTYQNYLDRYSCLVGGETTEDFNRFYDQICEGVKARFLSSNVTIHRMSTDSWFDRAINKYTLDWIYVDASHAYEQVLKDLNNSLRVVKYGGFIIGDDYSDKKPGVKAAVNDFISSTDYVLDNFYDDQYKINL
jgi:hypothetical protein|tara:strand:- start:202 stop:780 length:579 start_codon:yes stop_codon:yes gene_type:complete